MPTTKSNEPAQDKRSNMQLNRHRFRKLTLSTTLVFVGALSAKAAITLDILENTLGQRASYNIKAVSSVGAGINANEWIGIYQFASKGSEGPADPFWSICLSPAGVLDTRAHDYLVYNFGPALDGGASPGRNPAQWAGSPDGDYGIQNTQYLWRLLSPDIIATGDAIQGTALALAMYYALYDSTGYGAVDKESDKFRVTQASAAILSKVTEYLGNLNPSSVANNIGTGNILRSNESGAGQDLIWNVAPVPEPTTVLAAALLLLPFGLSTIRVLRKSR